MADLSNKTVAFVTSASGVENAELVKPRQGLEEAGARTVLLAPEAEVKTVVGDDSPAETFPADGTLADARPEDYDAVVIPGGTINGDTVRLDEDAIVFVRKMGEAGKPVAAICHGPWLLIESGLAAGRRTSYPSLRSDLTNAGADWVDQEVVVDTEGLTTVITSRNPDDIPAFTQAVVEAVSAR